MQSYLQFRRIGLAARAQVDRDLEKATRLTARPQQPEEPRPSSSSSSERGENAEKKAEEEEEKKEEEGGDSSVMRTPGRAHDPSAPPSRYLSTSQAPDESARLDRVQTAATARTQHTARAALGHSLTGVHARERRTHEGDGGPVFVVGWEGAADPLSPRNWSVARRVGVTLQIALIAFAVCAASSIDAAVLPQAAAAFGVSEVAESLATGLFLVGFGCGSLVAGPFSETFGRNAVYMGSLSVYGVWIMAAGLAPNLGAQLAFRFLAGSSASTPLVCAGGSIADLYDPLEKTWGFPLFAIAGFGGPVVGPVVGGYIGPSPPVSWRWTEWIMLIAAGLVLTLVFFCMPETYAPLLLRWKAQHLRSITGDARFQAEHEIVESTLWTRLKVALTRPFLMATEPIIVVMTLYLTVIYIVLFTFLDGYTYIFQDTYGVSQGLTNVIFVAMFVGILAVGVLVPAVYRATARELERARALDDGAAAATFNPEIRLLYAMLGAAPAIPAALFWMGWTADLSISIWSPIVASALFGFGIVGIFICTYMYIIDAYETYAASALTLVALVRYLAAGGMTVAGIPFYENMGVHYTLTILACIAAAFAPVPYLLYRYGHIIRRKSKYAVSREI